MNGLFVLKMWYFVCKIPGTICIFVINGIYFYPTELQCKTFLMVWLIYHNGSDGIRKFIHVYLVQFHENKSD